MLHGTLAQSMKCRPGPLKVVVEVVVVGVLLSACLSTSAIAVAPHSRHRSGETTAGVIGPAPGTVALFGDSLAGQATPSFSGYLKRATGAIPVSSTLDGTAPCDALPGLLAAARTKRFAVVVMDFSGNSLTPCMSGAPAGSSAYFSRYRYDMGIATSALVNAGTSVVLAGSPQTLRQYRRSGTSWEWLNDMLASVARTDPAQIHFVNAGESVMDAGHFTWSLPCLRDEVCLNEPSAGRDIVRSPDGSHFCPNARPSVRGVVGPCTEYMSGAFRYGTAMAAAALQLLTHR